MNRLLLRCMRTPAAGTSKPLADALNDADGRHDGFGAAIWHLTEAYLRLPDVPANVRSSIERVRAAFIPQLDVLQASYVNESKAAIDNKNDLGKLENDLKSISIAGSLSLYDWCSRQGVRHNLHVRTVALVDVSCRLVSQFVR